MKKYTRKEDRTRNTVAKKKERTFSESERKISKHPTTTKKKENDTFSERSTFQKKKFEHPLHEAIKEAYRGEPFKQNNHTQKVKSEKPFTTNRKYQREKKHNKSTENLGRHGEKNYQRQTTERKKNYREFDDRNSFSFRSSKSNAVEKNKNKSKNPVKQKFQREITKEAFQELRLNRYIANAGICSRRDADELIRSGAIMVNGKTVTELGTKVKKTDVVTYKGKVLVPERLVYVLLNKPKDYITTTDDPEQRKTVMELVKEVCQERIYPVGRLDRNTTGLLLLTNDGELAKLLSHPSSEVEKLYEVAIDKPLARDHEMQIRSQSFALEDGPVQLDAFEILNPSRTLFGIQLHSGRNRIVRRIFEKFGYKVEKLDRVVYAGLTKKDLPRGHWRFLSEEEVIRLKHFTVRKKKELETLAKINWEDFED